MANPRAKREERTDRIVSARHRAVTHKSGFSVGTLNPPAGMEFIQVKIDESLTITVLPFKVGESINRFSQDIRSNSNAQPGDLYYEQTFFTHREVGPEAKPVVCPRRTFGKRCPICEYRAALMKEPAADQEEIKNLAPKERQVFCVLDHKNPKKGPQLLEISFHLFGKLLDTRIKTDPQGDTGPRQYFHSPGKDGMTLILTVTGKTMGGGKPFPEVTAIDFEPRKNQLKAEWLAAVPNLCDLPAEIPYNELGSLFRQDDGETPAESTEAPQAAEASAEGGEWGDDAPAVDDQPKLWTVGETCCFTYKDETHTGEIVAINEAKQLAQVKVEGKDKPAVVKLEELVLPAEPEATADDWGTGDAPAAEGGDDWGTSGDEPAAETGAEGGDDWGTGDTPAEAPAEGGDDWGGDAPATEAPADDWGADPAPAKPAAKPAPAKAPPKAAAAPAAKGPPPKAPPKGPPAKPAAGPPKKPPVKK